MTFGLLLQRVLRPVGGRLPDPDPAQVATLAARLEAAGRRMARRPGGLLHVGTGGCGACRLEVAALEGPLFDIGRAGLDLVASPLEADILLVTGPGARNAIGPLRRAWEAMAPPRYVVAIGDCASGNRAEPDSYALLPGSIAEVVPIDLAVRGSPPPPEAILLGLLTLCAAAQVW